MPDFITKKPSSAVLKALYNAEHIGRNYSRSADGKIGTHTTNLRLVSVLQKNYATDEVIVKTKSEITRTAETSVLA